MKKKRPLDDQVVVRRAAGALAAVIALSGCYSNTGTLTMTPSRVIVATSRPTATLSSETPIAVPVSITPKPVNSQPVGLEVYPEDVNPLTGLAVANRSVLQRRPLLIKISNAPPVVRPQSGVSYADLVFEHYAEGGQTRFSALYYGQGVDHVGSVRSTRLVDLQLAPAYDAILVFSGGSLGVIDTLRLSPLYPFNTISPEFGVGEPYFVRYPREGLPFEHTLFSNTDLLWKWALDKRIRQIPQFVTPGMAFEDLVPAGGQSAAKVRLDYSRTNVVWEFDPLSGAYLRWSDGIPHTDALTGKQLAFENVVVISALHYEVDLFPEKYFGTEKSIYIELQGQGSMSLLRDGQLYDGIWHRREAESMFSFTDLNGNTLYLKPGKTFFQIIRAGFEQVTIDP